MTERPATIILDDRNVGLDAVVAVADGARVELSQDPLWRERISRGRARLEAALERGVPIYGVSTGVGNSSNEVVSGAEARDAFARSLVHQHGCGVGDKYSDTEARAITYARLVSLAKGYSAVRLELLGAGCALLNAGLAPVVPRLGSVGASGDLTPLSYVIAALMGDRELRRGGEVMPAAEALDQTGLEAFRIAAKESLAFMNGTSVMTAVGIISAHRLARTIEMAERAAALASEIMRAASDAFHPLLHRAKPHAGQVASAAALRAAFTGSGLVDTPRAGRLIQDNYSIRCAPQVLGAVRDALGWAEQVLRTELNSANDNPLVDPESGAVLFGGNFYGGHVGLAMDLLKVAIATMADLMDRQFALLLDARYNQGLPESLVQYGGNGVKGLQITATALTALLAQRSASDSVQSRPTEVGNQDKVSMGTNAANNASEMVDLLQQVLAAYLIALSNAARCRGEAQLSPAGTDLLRDIRARSAVLEVDRRLDIDLPGLVAYIDAGSALT